ncbi:cyclin-dependent kinase 2-interacting protein [Harpegnathos saltator]|uniref:cyclin-dependent kinase 2-interacting protein n=1 Tax=Harpegnathos saltator TaxID=610380 RepID=UPI00058C94E1|nr:cyclin-dependent kinase 2-interacting protein [Harpegnathos saltator]XP_019701126.1 cyclin-dependent kinase 2-interacting protein [Harpegnathos saltator]
MKSVKENSCDLTTPARKTFSPVKVLSPNWNQGKNLTGLARHIRDLVADIHTNIQQWNSLHLQGIICIKNITQEKQANNYYSTILQDLCDKLENICDNLDSKVRNLDQIKHQLKTLPALQKTLDKLFITWPTTKFGEVAEIICEAYHKEAKLKRKILENVAHNYTDSWKMLHLAAWQYQPSLPEDLTILLEFLLTETGHRPLQ